MYDTFRGIMFKGRDLCVIAALSVALAGCGSDGMATPTSTTAAATGTTTTGTTTGTGTTTSTGTTTGTGTTSTGTTGTGTTGTGTTGTGTTGTGTTGTGTTGTGTTGTGTTGTGTTGTGTTGTGTTGTGTTGTGTTGTGTATGSSITLTTPATTVNRMVVLAATPTAAAGAMVSSVTFLVDGVALGSTASPPYTFQWETGTVADGLHILTASLLDSTGKTTVSPSVSVKVLNNQAITFGLAGNQIFPATLSTASGFGTLTVNVVTGMATGNIVVTGTTPTAAAIFQGFAGQTGTPQIQLVKNGANPQEFDVPAGTFLTPAQVAMLQQGSMYGQVASANFPNGEIRGQIIPMGVTVTWSPLTATQELQVIATQATGTAATTVDTFGNNVTVFVNTTGVTGVTTAQVFTGAAGATGTELVALQLGTMNAGVFNPNQFSIQMFQIAAADLMNFQTSMWYINITTATNPMGLIRGQIIPAPTLTQVQAMIFSTMCTGCHTGVPTTAVPPATTTLPGSMNLTTAAASYKALVGVPSLEVPTVLRVAPGNPANSYLIQKLQGSVGITGKQMPLGGPYLSTAQINMIAQWITAGAQMN